MSDTYRAMCAELVDALDSGIPAGRIRMSPLADRARALLAQPVAEGPTDEELLEAFDGEFAEFFDSSDGFGTTAVSRSEWTKVARAVLARWGRPTPQPPAAGEVVVSLIELRSTVMGLGQMGMHVAAKRVERAADLLERFASPARLVINSSPEATND